MVLGGGPNRIGQGIEFDYCCVHAAFAVRDSGLETIIVNCNPETVSTDYDTSDKLYFEPLTVEDVLSIYEKEKPEGVIVQFGGQTPLNIAAELKKCGVPILGTTPETIDLAEDRDLFRAMMERLGIPMPEAASKVNGISDDMLRKQPPMEAVLPDFLRFIGSGILVAHNAPFDVSFINAALGLYWKRAEAWENRTTDQLSLLEPAAPEPEVQVDESATPWKPPFPALPNKVVDTRILAKELIPGRYSYKLQDLAEYLQIKALEAHRAEDDARVCMEVFLKCAQLIPATHQ